MPFVRQTNFGSGELAPLYWGRTDLEAWATGLRRCRNFFLSKQGAAVSRSGTQYLSNFGNDVKVRLVPFIFSDTQTYVLAFVSGRVDIFSSGAFVASVASPYVAAELPRLQWAQVGDVVTLCHPNHAPRELTRASHSSWSMAVVSFDRPTATIGSATAGDRTGALLAGTALDGDATHPAREWRWAITELRRDSRGVLYESKAFENVTHVGGAALPARLPVYPDLPITLTMFATYAQMGTDPNFVGYLAYRGRGLYGLVGSTKDITFTDAGGEPDYTKAPPQGRNPFKVFDAAGALVRTESPAAVTFFEERRFFAGTTQRPGWIFGSVVGDYANFDGRLVVTADMAIEAELAAHRREEIRSLVFHHRLLVFTDASVWSGGGAGGGALTPDSMEFVVQDQVGTNTSPPPLVIEGAILFARAKGTGARALLFDLGRGGYVASDISFLADHLFTGLTYSAGAYIQTPLVDWTYQEDPWGIVWAAKGDGGLLSLTHGGERWGWARHDTQGQVLSVCAVPEGDEDAVYLAVQRQNLFGLAGNWTTLERMTSRLRRATTSDDVCVDCAVTVTQSPSKTVTHANLSVLADLNVFVVSKSNPPYGPLLVTGGNTVTLPEVPLANSGGNWVGWIGLLYTPELELLDVAQGEARMKQKTVVRVGLEVDQSKGLHVGPDFENLVEWQQRQVSGGYGVPSAATELVEVYPKASWNNNGRAALRQTLPLPVTVVGVTRELEVGG
ncbi:MAG: hypothetical protein ACRD4T_00180 [Candidatus Acidiferrales bacterium]